MAALKEAARGEAAAMKKPIGNHRREISEA